MTNNKQQGGVKLDQGKAPMSLLDREALEQIAQVLAYGAKKYSTHNWRKGISYSRLTDAALRHLYAFNDGQDLDPESQLPHLAHAGCCIMFLLWMVTHRFDLDDRHHTEQEMQAIEGHLTRIFAKEKDHLSSDMADLVAAAQGFTDGK